MIMVPSVTAMTILPKLLTFSACSPTNTQGARCARQASLLQLGAEAFNPSLGLSRAILHPTGSSPRPDDSGHARVDEG